LGRIATVFLGTNNVGPRADTFYAPLFAWRNHPKPLADRRVKGSDAAGAVPYLEALGADRLCVYALGLDPWIGDVSTEMAEQPPDGLRAEAQRAVEMARQAGFRDARELAQPVEFVL
jgi:hypothetical protein